MLIKHCLKEFFYEFDPASFKIKRHQGSGSYQGKLFVHGRERYVLWIDGNELIFQTKTFSVNVSTCDFVYGEEKIYCYLKVTCSENVYTIKQLRSIWELMNLSTYDYLDKIEDNHLYYLYDVVHDFKGLKLKEEIERFVINF